jgi:hypothetical protein
MQNYEMTPMQVFEISQRRAEHEQMMGELVLEVATIEIQAMLDQPRGWN